MIARRGWLIVIGINAACLLLLYLYTQRESVSAVSELLSLPRLIRKVLVYNVSEKPSTYLPKNGTTSLPGKLPKTENFANDSAEDVLEKIRNYTNHLPNVSEVSVVTAYFNLGNLQKRGSEGRYTPDLYQRWMGSFGWLDNPLVVFTDTEETAQYFRQLRARYPASRTTVIVLNRDELWAFRLAEEIRAVFAQPGYPKHPPNTINPLYSCAMHAKFELVQRAVLHRLYQSRYVAWLDIGLFRDEAKKTQTIHLTAPDDFDRKKVAYSMVHQFQNLTPVEIVRQNKVWVGGASFLATPEVAFVYCSEYRRAVRKLLDMKIMSTDQQVIYSMYQPSFHFQPQIELQTYTRRIHNAWFDLGYIMKTAP